MTRPLHTVIGLVMAASVAACGAGPVPSSAPAPAVGSAVAPAPPAPPPAPRAPYGGHGVTSLSAEVLARFRPAPLAPEVSRRIQRYLDVLGPTVGELTSDGQRLYFAWAVTGVSQIWGVAGAGRFPRQYTGGEDSTQLFAITPDGATLVLTRDRAGEENPGIYLQPAGGGALQVVQHQPGVQSLPQVLSDDGQVLYFVANDASPDSYAVYRYHLGRGERETLLTQPGLWRVLDVWGRERLLLQRLTGALTSELWELELGTLQLSPRLGQGRLEELDARYGRSADELIVKTHHQGNFRRLYRWQGGELSPLGPEQAADVVSFALDRGRRRLLYTTNEGGYSRLHALDGKRWRTLPLPPLPRADHVWLGATSANGRFTSLGVDDGTQPTQTYVLDWTTRQLTRWHTPSSPELDASRFARARLESYPARDGTPIPVLIRRPQRCAADPCPVIVHFHGGPESQARPGFSPHAQVFVDAGFVFVEPNVRGSDGYGKAWLAADDGPKRLAIITDIEDASRWARQAFASGGRPPKLGVYGGSYGGYSVLMAMTRFAGAYDAGVNVVGISDLRTFLANTAPYRRALRISEYGDPQRDAEALALLSPMSYLERAQAPLLTLQGATDPRVPAGEAVQIHEALEARGVESQLMLFPDEGHGAKKRSNRVLMLGHAVAFFERHLLGARP